MAWSVIRKATESDIENLDAAAVRFCERHGIVYERESDALSEVDNAIDARGAPWDEHVCKARRLRPLWRRIVRRALGSPNATGIAYGYVGYPVQ